MIEIMRWTILVLNEAGFPLKYPDSPETHRMWTLQQKEKKYLIEAITAHTHNIYVR